MLLCVSQTPNGLDLDMVKENMEAQVTSLEQEAIRHGRNKIRKILSKRPNLCFFAIAGLYLDFVFRRVPLLLCC